MIISEEPLLDKFITNGLKFQSINMKFFFYSSLTNEIIKKLARISNAINTNFPK